MRTTSPPSRTDASSADSPPTAALQTLIACYQRGDWTGVIAGGGQLLKRYPQAVMVLNLVGAAEAAMNQFDAAATHLREAVRLAPDSPETQSNLGNLLLRMGQPAEALPCFLAAIALRPQMPELHFNAGIAFAATGQAEDAVRAYRQAITLRPGFAPALARLAALLQAQGELDAAIDLYRQALAAAPDAQTWFNLATAQRNAGLMHDSIASYRQAIALQPGYAAAHSNLGEALRDAGEIDAAIASYRQALALDPQLPQAHYSLGILLYDLGAHDPSKLTAAIPHFQASQLDDWHDRVLYCLYKTGQLQAFREQLDARMASGPHTAPLLATLSAHHAANHGLPDHYRFCPDPLGHVYHGHISALDAADGLRAALLRDIEQAEIAQRDQGRLHHGVQSSGNLFRRPEESFRQLAELVREHLRHYRQRFAGSDCALFTHFPNELDISSSWYVKMQRGGHLDSHIHETGWVSGVLYLKLPTQAAEADAGKLEFSTNGDNYPLQHHEWPRKVMDVQVGDIVLFPSSLFHRTIPFDSAEERVCIAFDLKPR